MKQSGLWILAIALGACSSATFEKLPEPPVPACNNFYQSCTTEEVSGTEYNNFDYTETIADRKVDILFVDDNSSSMQAEQAKMASAFSGFIDSLSGINWHIGVMTTDVRHLSAGHLLDFQPGSGLYVLTPAIPDHESLFKGTIKRSEIGSGDERGIYALNLLLDRAGQAGEPELLREKAHLAVVILSDEDERSTGGLTVPFEEYDKPDTLISRFQEKYRGEKTMSVHSIIIKPGDIECLRTQQAQSETGREGKTYADLSSKTGGLIGDICSADYGSQLDSIAQNINETVDSFPLACPPVDGQIQVTFDPPQAPEIPYHLEDAKLVLELSPSAGTQMNVKYRCIKR